MNQPDARPRAKEKPLAGYRALVPRGGPWGDSVAASLRERGAVPVVAALVDFARTNDPEALDQALADLEQGAFDWVTLTSATTVDVLYTSGVTIPEHTKLAAVGETTAAALLAAGLRVDAVPESEDSAYGLGTHLIELEPEPRRFLTLRSETATPVVTPMLIEAGHDVRSVAAFRTVGVPASDRVRRDVASGRINLILITSATVAEQVREQFPDLPETTVLAATGPRTAKDARALGLVIDLVAPEQNIASLLQVVATIEPPKQPEGLTEPITGILDVQSLSHRENTGSRVQD